MAWGFGVGKSARDFACKTRGDPKCFAMSPVSPDQDPAFILQTGVYGPCLGYIEGRWKV